MTQHTCESAVVTCIDFRFQTYLTQWLTSGKAGASYDRISLAGSVKNTDSILAQLEISKRLHSIKKVILINHEDCGAYGAEGTPDKHAKDLRHAKQEIQSRFADVAVETYYLKLDGTFEQI